VEASLGEVRLGETEGGRSKGRIRKETRGKRKEKEAEERKKLRK